MLMKSKMELNYDALIRFRDILYFEIIISNSTYFLYLALFYSIGPLIGPFLILKIILIILALAAILFTPYIFYVLINEKRYGWIVTFFVLIVIPLVAGYFIFKDTLAFEASILIPLGIFYFYCYLLKFAVDDWIREYSWKMHLAEQRREKEERIKNQML